MKKSEAHFEMLSTFRNFQRQTGRDTEVCCTDITPVAEWYATATEREKLSLLEVTPIRLPVPSLLLGCVLGGEGEHEAFPLVLGARRSPTSEPCIELWNVVPTKPETQFAAALLMSAETGRWEFSISPIDELPLLDRGMSWIVASALAMFHVQNIGTREVRYPRVMRRKDHREGIEGPQIYRTLTLRPFGTPNVPSTHLSTGERALHLVRGHFVHYTRERPMLGKYAGTFWKPEHDAGNPEKGIIRKTYNWDTNAS